MNFGYFLSWLLIYIPIRTLYPTTVMNKKGFRASERAVVVCNHMSNMDIVVIKSHQPFKQYVLAKHTLFQNKFFGCVLKSYGGIPVNRQEVGVGTIRTVLDLLKNNKQVLLFPEGTRSSSLDEANAIKNGVAMFALKSNSPIIPMMFLYRPKMFRFNKLLVGQPIDLSQYLGKKVTKEMYAEIADFVLDTMKKLRDDYIQSLPERKRTRVLSKLHRFEARDKRKFEKRRAKKAKK